MVKLAIIRIRGTDDVNKHIADTMLMLKLHKKNVCSVYDATPVIRGMADKCKDYVTYGELDEETYKLLMDKRAIRVDGTLQNYFHLQPPRGGFGKGGIKHPFSMKGALGYRAEKINELIRKMI